MITEMETPASLPEWPGDADAAVALTFDVDAEAPWLGEGPEYASCSPNSASPMTAA